METLLNKILALFKMLLPDNTDSAWDSYRKSKVLATQPIRKDTR